MVLDDLGRSRREVVDHGLAFPNGEGGIRVWQTQHVDFNISDPLPPAVKASMAGVFPAIRAALQTRGLEPRAIRLVEKRYEAIMKSITFHDVKDHLRAIGMPMSNR